MRQWQALAVALFGLAAAFAALSTWAVASTPAAATPVAPALAPQRSLGVVTCANSLCHGAVKEVTGGTVRQDEYVTWSRLDKHARAFEVLRNDQSRRIAAKLGLPKPAHESAVCLDCHSHNVPTARRDPRLLASDGVSCEACHGPAEGWLARHVEPPASHADNLAHGLYPTEQPRARAELCLGCHFGNARQFVSHRMMGAGHPRLSFELDTFSAIAPAHHRVDADYHARKPGAGDGVTVWAIGQALAVASMMDVLVDPKRGRDGLFPELVLFDCHACHHPMSQQRWAPRVAFGASPGPGVVRLNDSGLLMLRAIARSLDPALGQRLGQQVARLQRAAAGEGDALREAAAVKRLALEIAARVEAQPLPVERLSAVALALIDEGLAGHYGDYAGAEQAAMAIASVVDALHRRGLLAASDPANAALARLNASLANDEAYQPALFRQRLRELRAVLLPRRSGGASP